MTPSSHVEQNSPSDSRGSSLSTDQDTDRSSIGDALDMSVQGSDALIRTFQELKQAKNQDLRNRASLELNSLIATASRGKVIASTLGIADFV